MIGWCVLISGEEITWSSKIFNYHLLGLLGSLEQGIEVA